MMRVISFLIILCLTCVGCHTSKSVESSTLIQVDSAAYFSQKEFHSASMENVHDSVRIKDSVRVVVDSMGNIQREFYFHTETKVIVDKRVDTVFVSVKDSANSRSTSNKTKEKKPATKDRKNYDLPFWVAMGLLAVLSILKYKFRRNG